MANSKNILVFELNKPMIKDRFLSYIVDDIDNL